MSSIKEVICICCPCGCHLQVDPENDYNVTGNACPNGAAYGREELTHPTRIITSTVRVVSGDYVTYNNTAYGNDVVLASKFIFITTLLCIITIPIFVMLL